MPPQQAGVYGFRLDVDGVARASDGLIRSTQAPPTTSYDWPGRTAQMTYYETRSGARVFAAGAFHLTRVIHRDAGVSRMIENLWARLAHAQPAQAQIGTQRTDVP